MAALSIKSKTPGTRVKPAKPTLEEVLLPIIFLFVSHGSSSLIFNFFKIIIQCFPADIALSGFTQSPSSPAGN